MNRKPLKRSWIRPKKRVRSESWRTGRVREDAKGMARLRSEAYARSNGFCECGCGQRVGWIDGHLHHRISRAHGGSDVLDNVWFVTRPCHERIHGKPVWSPPNWLEEIA